MRLPKAAMMSGLQGLRIMIVEDDALVALNLQEFAESLGCAVVGPVGRLKDALAMVDTAELDGAVLDINLHGEMVYPLAERLAEDQIPMLFCSGYALTSAVPAKFSRFKQIPKPCAEHTLKAAMVEVFTSSAASAFRPARVGGDYQPGA